MIQVMWITHLILIGTLRSLEEVFCSHRCGKIPIDKGSQNYKGKDDSSPVEFVPSLVHVAIKLEWHNKEARSYSKPHDSKPSKWN